jgi:general secretion pathway protein I
MYKNSKVKSQKLEVRIKTPNSQLRTPNSDGGFTLLEVMIALSIVAGVIITVLTTLNYQLGIVNDSRDVVIATILGKSLTGKIGLSSLAEKKEGNFGSEYPEFSWGLNLKDTQFKTLKHMDVKVLWGKGRDVSIASYNIKK